MTDPHQSEKPDPDPDPHLSKQLDLDSHQIKKTTQGPRKLKMKPWAAGGTMKASRLNM